MRRTGIAALIVRCAVSGRRIVRSRALGGGVAGRGACLLRGRRLRCTGAEQGEEKRDRPPGPGASSDRSSVRHCILRLARRYVRRRARPPDRPPDRSPVPLRKPTRLSFMAVRIRDCRAPCPEWRHPSDRDRAARSGAAHRSRTIRPDHVHPHRRSRHRSGCPQASCFR